MKYDLPSQKAELLAHPDWDFTLSHHGRDFEASMQEIEGIQESAELPLLKNVVVRIIEDFDSARNCAAEVYWPEYNERWATGVSITRDEFIRRLHIGTISIDADLSVSLEFGNDEDMFDGHAIVVHFTRDFTIRDVELIG